MRSSLPEDIRPSSSRSTYLIAFCSLECQAVSPFSQQEASEFRWWVILPEILHGACPETLRGACPEILHGVYPEQDQILRGVYTERSECAQDDPVRRVHNDIRRATMTSVSSVILEPFGPERASRAGSAKGKNLNSCRALALKSQTYGSERQAPNRSRLAGGGGGGV